MSARSLAELAKERDIQPSGTLVKSATEVLVAAVPSEALAAYTALVGIMLAANIGSGYGALRWSAYGVFIALAVLAALAVYQRRIQDDDAKDKDTRRVPVWECLAAALAAAAWGLVMPGSPLGIVLQGDALVFATTAIALGAATLLGFATEILGRANGRNTPVPPVPAAPVPPAPQAAQAPPPVPLGRGSGPNGQAD